MTSRRASQPKGINDHRSTRLSVQEEIDALAEARRSARASLSDMQGRERHARRGYSPNCRAHRVYPKDLWKTHIVTLGSVAGINTRYELALKALYGPVVIREIHGATEGMFGQQQDEKRTWWTPLRYA